MCTLSSNNRLSTQAFLRQRFGVKSLKEGELIRVIDSEVENKTFWGALVLPCSPFSLLLLVFPFLF